MRPEPKVTHGFVSFTEVEPGEHQSYNAWHLFDHLPEQLPLPGIAWGRRWVLPPELERFRRADAPLDRVHYVTLYLLAEPVAETLAAFRALGQRLRDEGRFHLHRTSHLSGPLAVRSSVAAARVQVSAEAVPYRPSTGVYVRLTTAPGQVSPADLVTVPGVAGVWAFAGGELSPGALRGTTAIWCWLDGDPAAVALRLAERFPDDAARFDGSLAAIDPWGPWDWFDDL